MEKIKSLQFEKPKKSLRSRFLKAKVLYLDFYLDAYLEKFKTMSSTAVFTWFGSSAIASIFVLALLLGGTNSSVHASPSKYSIFSAKPLVLGVSSERILSADARAAALDKVLEDFDCPMQGMGKKFVEEADKNGIPYWLVAAVAFQESSCGKKTPEKNGVESWNGWGWGVWGDNVKFFDDWGHGIEAVSKYMADTFYSKGVTDPCDIMKIYTPPSQGSWCTGVNYFKDVITKYESPDLTL